jgi:hypothetical protein
MWPEADSIGSLVERGPKSACGPKLLVQLGQSMSACDGNADLFVPRVLVMSARYSSRVPAFSSTSNRVGSAFEGVEMRLLLAGVKPNSDAIRIMISA